MTVRQFLLAVRYRWRTALAVWAGTVLVVIVLAALLIPLQYRASSEILVEDENTETASAANPQALAARLATQADVVRSERVMLRAIRAMGLQNRRDLRDKWESQAGGQGDYDSWLVELLQKKTDVRPTRDSKVLYVSHASPDRKFAADFVNALVQAYKDTALELRMEPARRYQSFYDDRVRQARERLQQAQQKSSEFQRQNGITTTDEKQDVEDARLSDLSAQVVGLQARAGEARRRRAEAAANPNAMEDVLKDPTVASLTAAMALQEAKHNEITERLGSRHPQVIESESVIAALSSRLEAAKRRAAASFQGGSNVAESQLAERSKALEAQREKVLQRRALRDQARLLQNEVELAQREFEAVITRLNKATTETIAPQSNISVLKVATAPSLTISASPVARLSFAAVAGLLLALVAMVVIEARDRRLRDEDDVQSTLDQPVLAVVRRRRSHGAPSPGHALLVRPQAALTNGRFHAAQ